MATVSACLPAAAQAQLLRRDTALLGAKHAAEHARAREQQCEAERGLRPIPAKGVVSTPEATLQADAEVVKAADALAAGLAASAKGPTQQAVTAAATQGSWSDPFIIPVVGITSVLLHTGKVLFWSYDPANYHNPASSNTGVSYLWDPATRTGQSIVPPENIWCGGQTILADGRVFVAGGNLRYPDSNAPAGTQGWEGSMTTYTFNPQTFNPPSNNGWLRQADMSVGRWYPTTTKLADNRVVITSGYDQSGTQAIPAAVEIFTPTVSEGKGTISVLPVSHAASGLYPLQFVLPSGKMLEAGPDVSSSYEFDPGTGNWNSLSPMRLNHYGYGNGISYTDASVTPTRQVVMVAGGENGTIAVAGNEWLEGTNPLGGWQAFPQWIQGRHNSNTVILPDGSLLTIGGNKGVTTYGDPLLDVEWYPRAPTDTTGLWQKMAPHSVQAAYHSSAILLPDATVLLSQDDMDSSAAAAAQHKAQIYSPPYLFKGARPQVNGPASLSLRYGQSFNMTLDRNGAASVILIAPGATTHGNDMHQRAVKLPVKSNKNTLTATIPASAAVLPPGYYMLFVVSKGVPSIAKFVRVS